MFLSDLQMVELSISGILLNLALLIFIIVILFIGLSYRSQLETCENKQSPYCYTVQCPCDLESAAPCFGYAKQPGETSGTWYCSDAPYTLVDNNGNVVSS